MKNVVKKYENEMIETTANVENLKLLIQNMGEQIKAWKKKLTISTTEASISRSLKMFIKKKLLLLIQTVNLWIQLSYTKVK